MKDEFQPLEPVGHEATEARIVAWVHGEVSEVEAVELEKFCAVRPDLERFRCRIAELHGLLGEVTTGDSSWVLSPERRARLDAAFLGAPVGQSSKAGKTTGRWVRPVLLAAAACVALATGFHFIVGPVGGNRQVAKEDRSLPVIAAATHQSKAPADFRADDAFDRLDEVTSSTRALPAPTAPAAMPPLALTGDKLVDEVADASPLRFPEVTTGPVEFRSALPTEQPLASASSDYADVSSGHDGIAPLQKWRASTASALAGMAAGEVEVTKDEALATDKSSAPELGKKFQAGVRSSDLHVEKQGDGWRFSRVTKDRRDDLFDVSVSDSPASHAFKLSSKTTVKLLAVDEKGAECWKKEILVNGKPLTVEAWLRQILERE